MTHNDIDSSKQGGSVPDVFFTTVQCCAARSDRSHNRDIKRLTINFNPLCVVVFVDQVHAGIGSSNTISMAHRKLQSRAHELAKKKKTTEEDTAESESDGVTT